MNLSAIWIRRPVMTILVMFGILFFGVISYDSLPINNLPAVEFPTIQVTASLPGASPETVASTIAKPLEKQFSSIAGLASMSSTSYQGSTTIILQFSLDRNIDNCAQDVSTKISAASGDLPANLPSPPTYDKVNPADEPIYYIVLTSDEMPLTKLTDYAENYLAQNFSTVDGVAQVIVYGQRFAVRVQVNPKLLANKGIGINDVETAIKNANVNLPGGSLDGPFQSYTVDSNGQIMTAKDYKSTIINYQDGKPVRLGDVGTAIEGVEKDKQFAAWYGNKEKIQRAVLLAIKKQPGANVVKVADGIRQVSPRLKAMIPNAIEWRVLYDASDFIKESIHDVQFTLILTILIVLVVIFLFLRSVRSTIIPNIAIPLSIVATFAGMNILGYSMNNLSLMALVLAVGLVVDDAIVMLENIVRRMEMGESAMEASLNGSKEIGFTIFSMTISLVVVFIPIIFMPGIVGRLFREFAVSIAIAILISGFISLTLTPMLCSLILKGFSEKKEGKFYTRSEDIFNKAVSFYGKTLWWVLKRRGWTLVFVAFILILTGVLIWVIPKGFLPAQDQSFLMASTRAADRISFADMVKHQEAANELFISDPDMKEFLSIAGLSSYGEGILFGITKNLAERKRSVDMIVNDLRPKLNSIPGYVAYVMNPPPIQIGAGQSTTEYQVSVQGSDLGELYKYSGMLEEKMKSVRGLADVNSDIKLNSPKALIHVDRDRASALGLSLNQVQDAFFSAFASRKISTIYGSLNDYNVILEVEPQFKEDPNALAYLYIKSTENKLVPLSTVARIEETTGPTSVNHVGQLNSATVNFNLKPGYSIGNAVSAVKKIVHDVNFPQTITYAFQGSAQEFMKSFAGMGFLLFITILVIYMVLGILYESFIHPITILTALPLAGFGAALTLVIFGRDLDLYGMVGMILLVGIVKKNGIMMVDFALEEERLKGAGPEASIHQACMVRFRPIMMTSMAAIFGSLPIALGIGAGGDARQPMGLAVVGGLIFSQIMTLYVTPVFYVYFDELNRRLTGKKE